MSKGFASTYRTGLLAGALAVSFIGIGVRLVWLHVVDRESGLRTIAKTRYQLIPEVARRGDILDAKGKFLATSRSSIELGVDPSALVETEKEKQKWPQLAALLGMPESELRRIFLTKFRSASPTTPASAASPATGSANLVFDFGRPAGAAAEPARAGADDSEVDGDDDGSGRRPIKYVKLADDLSQSTYDAIKKLNIHGVYPASNSYRRVYPNGQLAAHIVGFVDHQQHPLSGMEFYTDFYLRGQNGWRVGERDGQRRELPQFETRNVPRADGYSVSLSIDAMVQDVIEQELELIAKKFQPEKASIIVSDPQTGFILGMANYPTYNPNEYYKVKPEEQARLKNVAVTDIYDPGSVFKIVAASAALEEGMVTPDTVFDVSHDRVTYRGQDVKLPADDHPFENPRSVPLTRVISFSSNRGAAALGMMLGDERLDRYARAFGFGRLLGFPVGGEVRGILHPYSKWKPIDTTRIAMGQSVAVTVLQMHQAMSVIANGGVLLRPQIIQEIRDASGERVFKYGRVELNRVVSAETARKMAVMLMGVATKNGTAPGAAIAGFDVAGKTGTTQKYMPEVMPNGSTMLLPSKTHHVASFVGFFPANPRPGDRQVAISVIVDDADAHAPGGVAYGSAVAAPSFKAIGEKLIPILDIKSPNPSTRYTFAMEGGRR
jgi:cell division protein FtsI (penicillin-binding protein 3)